MKRIFYFVLIDLLVIFTISSCGGDTPADPPAPKPPDEELLPDAVVLSAPVNNSPCLAGTLESKTTASVSFAWNKAANANMYVLEIKNLKTEQTTKYTTTEISYSAVLTIGMPYSWSVTSVNSAGRVSSTVWKFYLSGVAESSYAPFPAELTAPVSGAVLDAKGEASIQVHFAWEGNDVDNDIASYSFYLDNENASTQIIASQTETSVTQTLQAGKTYYWKVVTTDKKGNKSNSMVSSFQIRN